jgi:hypothetical protein
VKASRQTKLKLRKGFDYAPLQYRVLAVSMLSDSDKEYVARQLLHVTNDVEAMALLKLESNGKFRWGLRWAITIGFSSKCAIIAYKGVEVALLYRRVTNLIEPLPEDPKPVGMLESEDDVWVLFLLNGESARHQQMVLRKAFNELMTKLNAQELEKTAENKLAKRTELEVQVATLQKEIREQGAELSKLQIENKRLSKNARQRKKNKQ